MANLGTSVRGGIVAMHIARTSEGTAAAGCMAAESGSKEGSDILLSRSGYIVVAG